MIIYVSLGFFCLKVLFVIFSDESLTTERVIVKFTRKEEFPMDFDMLLGVTRLTLNVAGTISYLISIIQKVVTLLHQQKEDSSTPSK